MKQTCLNANVTVGLEEAAKSVHGRGQPGLSHPQGSRGQKGGLHGEGTEVILKGVHNGKLSAPGKISS